MNSQTTTLCQALEDPEFNEVVKTFEELYVEVYQGRLPVDHGVRRILYGVVTEAAEIKVHGLWHHMQNLRSAANADTGTGAACFKKIRELFHQLREALPHHERVKKATLSLDAYFILIDEISTSEDRPYKVGFVGGTFLGMTPPYWY
ncbi:hypothetical protein CYMTET_8264 [Cymbomonas tetramitiformis]|uniref:Uncharacterized protein n=1 Tax=Cymbomonas tetramitiformis TaxID=36881 RepID=A0AAE0GU16_9CHLO|nr:hypothetical protein CYMTET_8264 [Cymbomonas tetramitiformis]